MTAPTAEVAPALSELQGLSGAALYARLPRLTPDKGYLLAAVLDAGHTKWGAAILDAHGYTPAPAPCNHDAALGELQGMTVSGDTCTRCGAVQW